MRGRPFRLKPDTPDLEIERCAICLDDFRDLQTVSELECTHIYHPHCIKAWFLKKRICPVCISTVEYDVF